MSQRPTTKEHIKRQPGVASVNGSASNRTKRDGGPTDENELVFDLYRRSVDQLFELINIRESQAEVLTDRDEDVINNAIDLQQEHTTRLEASAMDIKRYPGELFSSMFRGTESPTPRTTAEAIQMETTDLVLLRGKSTERTFELFRQLFGAVADEGVIVLTKHVADDVVESVAASPLTVIDCTSSGRYSLSDNTEIRHVHSGNLTQLGTELLDVLDLDAQDRNQMVGLYSLGQLSGLKSGEVQDQFLNVLTGKLRSRGIGALVATGSPTEDDPDWSKHFDYTVTHRQGTHGVDELRVSGKLGVQKCWEPVRLE